MPGEARSRRPDGDGADGRYCLERLIERLGAADVSFDIDPPNDPAGDWWIDLSFAGFSTNVAWRHDRGFGIFTSDEDAYGAGPDEIYRDERLAAARLRQLAKRTRNDRSAMKLGEVRQLFDQPQTEIARRLGKDQAFISRLERQNDALISTVRGYVEALGGEIRLLVRFDGFEAAVDLPRARHVARGERS